MNKKNPFLVYILFWITLGIYGFFWFASVMDFINKQSNKHIYNVKLVMTSVIAFLVIVMTAEMNFMPSGPKRGFTLLLFFVFFFINLGWIAFLSFSLHHVSKHIKQIQESRGIEKQIKPGLSAFLFFVYFTGIAYIQTHINRTLDAALPGSSGGAKRNSIQ